MVIIAILVLGFLIFVHELGHFMVAKMAGIKVLEFSIGFGPKLLGLQKNEDATIYSLRILPLGGFVRLAGMDPEDEDHVDGYNTKPLKSRFAVISAGAAMNFIVAILLFVLTFGLIGQPAASNSNMIGEVVEESPALVAGLEAGDRIVSINGVATGNWDEIASNIQKSGERELTLTIERDQEESNYLITPRYDLQYETYQIGITQQLIWQKQGLMSAVKLGLTQTYEFTKLVLVGLGGLIQGTISTDELAGPVGITVAIGEAATGGIGYLLIFTAILSINLGLLNILPIPALDGSKLVFLLIEGLRGKPIAPEKENLIHFIGFALLMVLFVLVTYNDIARIFTGG